MRNEKIKELALSKIDLQARCQSILAERLILLIQLSQY